MSAHRRRFLPAAASTVLAVFFTFTFAWGGQGSANAAPKPPPAVTITSVTVDPQNADGVTTNAPGGWTSNPYDVWAKLGIAKGTTILNVDGSALGPGPITLKAGANTFKIYGTGTPNGLFPENKFYGLVLFFGNEVTNPQIAAYNDNPSAAPKTFRVNPKGATVTGVAYGGGPVYVQAPGSSLYTAADGATVELTGFAINAAASTTDLVGWATVVPDGNVDMVATVTLQVTVPKN